MGNAGIFPFYCHFALLILNHWHCCLHCPFLTGKKPTMFRVSGWNSNKWDEIQIWFCWTVQMLTCFCLSIWSRVCFFIVFMCSWDCVWPWLGCECVSTRRVPKCVSVDKRGPLRSCIYSHVNIIILWMCVHYCVLILVFA